MGIAEYFAAVGCVRYLVLYLQYGLYRFVGLLGAVSTSVKSVRMYSL